MGGLSKICSNVKEVFQGWKSKKPNFPILKAWLCVQRIPILLLYPLPCSIDFKN